jgi:hypothetical protein
VVWWKVASMSSNSMNCRSMNCKTARGLFSARIDDELSPAEAGSLEMHLRDCTGGCRDQWAIFEATVRMVRALPPIEPDPSFVGHVLDRVRAWEAQEAGRPVSAPVRVPWSTSVPGRGLAGRLREWFKTGDPVSLGEWFREFAGGLAGPRVLVPVRVVAAVALGVVGGLAIGQQALLSHRAASLPGLAGRTTVSAAAVPGGGVDQVQPTVNPARPFGDLAGDIPAVRAARGGADSIRVQPGAVGDDSATYPGGIDSRQVLTTPGDAHPRVTSTDGRPQFIF